VNYAAANYFVTSTSTETPRVRALYLLRKHLELLPPRKAAVSTPTASNSASLLVQQLAQTLVSDEPPQDSLLEHEGAGERVVDVEPAATASETVSEVTSARVLDRALVRHLHALLAVARDERFKDGMDSNLSVGLRVLFRNYSADFAHVLDERLKKRDIGARILVEILHALGGIEDDATRGWRLATLVDFLKSASPLVRDAAAVGLSYLDDKKAAPYLRDAIEREPSKALREDLRVILEQLGV